MPSVKSQRRETPCRVFEAESSCLEMHSESLPDCCRLALDRFFGVIEPVLQVQAIVVVQSCIYIELAKKTNQVYLFVLTGAGSC